MVKKSLKVLLTSLRFKDDVKEVAQGFECGLSFVKFNDIQEGDIVKFTTKQEIERSELE